MRALWIGEALRTGVSKKGTLKYDLDSHPRMEGEDDGNWDDWKWQCALAAFQVGREAHSSVMGILGQDTRHAPWRSRSTQTV